MKQCVKRTALLLLCMVLSLLPGESVLAEQALGLYARSAVLMDGDSGRIIFGKEENLPLPMASTTKIMTCILALEKGSGDMICSVSETAAAQPEVKLGMHRADTFYLSDLLYSLMLESHNDTAVCIAENVGGSVKDFARMMNRKAEEIGCLDTYFITPNGLDAEDENGVHHTTASDLARIMRYCILESSQKEEFLKITGTMNYSFSNLAKDRSYSCVNHNTLLQLMDGALSGKTGFTGNAGYCYVGAVNTKEGILIVSLLACGWPNNKGYKWSDTRKLIRSALENYQKKEITDFTVHLEPAKVRLGKKNCVQLYAKQKSFRILLSEKDSVTVEKDVRSSLEAPVEKDAAVGWIRYYVNGELVSKWPVLTGEYVEGLDYPYVLKRLCQSFFLNMQKEKDS